MFATFSDPAVDPYLAVAFWTGLAALGLTLLLGAQIVHLRMSLRREQVREARTLEKWRPLLNAALAGDMPQHLPPLPASERALFLKFWLHLHESLRGQASAVLNEFARRIGCEQAARTMLRGSRAQALLAILVLGHLRDASAWDALERHAQSPDAVISIQACWALVQLDAARAVQLLAGAIAAREEWPLAQLAHILADDARVAEPLRAAVDHAGPLALPRLLRLIEALRLGLPAVKLRRLLAHDDDSVVIAALRLVEDPVLAHEVRALAAHGDWRVRVQAARALGRIAGSEDVALLAAMVRDPEWWVRYRAAQALTSLPFIGPAELQSLQPQQDDRYAADMLQQVLAERSARLTGAA